MRPIAVLLLIFSVVLFPLPSSAQNFPVEELVEHCTKCSQDMKTGEKSWQCAFCDGIMTGVSSTYAMLELNKSFCPPPDLDTRLVRNIFRRWAKEHPDHAGQPAVWGVSEAIKGAWGCDQ